MAEGKWCRSCQESLPIEAFALKDSSEDGLHPFCMSCHQDWVERRYGTDVHVTEALRTYVSCEAGAPSDNGFGALAALLGKLPAERHKTADTSKAPTDGARQPAPPEPRVAKQPEARASTTQPADELETQLIATVASAPVRVEPSDAPDATTEEAEPGTSPTTASGDVLGLALLYGEAQRQLGVQETTFHSLRQELAGRLIEIDQLKLTIEELSLELEVMRLDLEAVSSANRKKAANAPTLRSVTEAVEVAALEFCDRLVFWKSARTSAQASDFARPEDVFRAFSAIDALAALYFDAKATNERMGAWESFFQQCGLKYAANESQNTLNQFGTEREFSHQGEKRLMQKHLTLGGGDRRNCLQIYFDVDESNERFIVGYCGRHLRYHRERT